VVLGYDPYAVLGVPRDATAAQIGEARRRLSREYHPDVNRAADAAARFDRVQQAFNLLSDPAARAEYDQASRHQAPAGPGSARTGSARTGSGRTAWDPGLPTEVASGIFVQPTSVDFGLLEPGRPRADVKVTVAWAGAPPRRITSEQGNEWWTTLGSEMPASSCVVFYLRAAPHAGAPNGRQRAQFTVTLDDASVAVQLTAEIRGVFPPASPADSPPLFGPARRGLPTLWRLWIVVALVILWIIILVWGR
jgi:hypothetical protein